MGMKNPSKDSIKEIIKEGSFATYAVRFDVNDDGSSSYDLQGFVNSLMYELTDFSYGGEYWNEVVPENSTQALSEAAKAIYQIPEFKKIQEMCERGESIEDAINDKNLRRGEFGELILFFLLKHFHDAIPLISKIYFKDHDASVVHGFDAVHFNEKTQSLWLGESKCYEDGKSGLRSLVSDIKEHIRSDYLKREFTLIGKKFILVPSVPTTKRDKILEILNAEKTLEAKVSSITIPLLCTFSSKSFQNFTSETEEFLKAYETEMRDMRKHFDDHNDHPLKSRLNIVLLLMPVKSKRELVAALHSRLLAAQSVIK